MKALIGLGAAAASLVGVHASGVLDRGEVYAKPYSVAYAELATMPVPPEAIGLAGAEAVEVEERPGRIDWIFRMPGGQTARFSATLSEEDRRHTRVEVEFSAGDPAGDAADRLINSDFLRSTARLALAEQVDARLDNRPFNSMKFGQALAEHQKANPQEVERLGHAVGGMFNQVAEQVRANSELDGSAQPGPPDRRAMEAATRPMINPPPQ